jgi:polyhydroxyalkanoate synthesis regulator phasin
MATTDGLQRELNSLQTALAKTQADMNNLETSTNNKLDITIANMNVVVEEAKVAFNQVSQEVKGTQANVQQLAAETKSFAETTEKEKEGIKAVVTNISAGQGAQIGQLTNRLEQLEQAMRNLPNNANPNNPNNNTTNDKRIGFLKTDDMTPNTFDGKVEEWREWKEMVEDFLEALKPGMKELLKEAETQTNTIPTVWTNATNPTLAQAQTKPLWLLLKAKTNNEAKKTILASEEGSGFGAWRSLCKRMEPNLEARKAKVLQDLSGVPAATNPGELREKVTELEQRIRRATQIAGDIVSHEWKKTLLEKIWTL